MGKYKWDSGRLILKLLFNFMMVIVGIALFITFLPLASFYEGVPIIAILGIVVGSVVAYLIWDANKATYEKVCTSARRGLRGGGGEVIDTFDRLWEGWMNG